MTDRVRYITVILDTEYRDDDAQTIADAIAMLKGVAQVELGQPVNVSDYVNRQTIALDFHKRIAEAMRGILFPEK